MERAESTNIRGWRVVEVMVMMDARIVISFAGTSQMTSAISKHPSGASDGQTDGLQHAPYKKVQYRTPTSCMHSTAHGPWPMAAASVGPNSNSNDSHDVVRFFSD